MDVPRRFAAALAEKLAVASSHALSE
jgi:hypothetical protein